MADREGSCSQIIDSRFAGQTVLITGGMSGIGRATAVSFAEAGANVHVADVDSETDTGRVQQEDEDGSIVDWTENAHDPISFHQLDVKDHNAFVAVVDSIVATEGGLDVLFNNAGVTQNRPFDETEIDERDAVVGVNLMGVWNGCWAAIPAMVERGGGAIINMTSVAALHGQPNAAAYALSKAGVVNLTQTLAAEYGPDGIRVNAICPGRIDTALLSSFFSRQSDPARARADAQEDHALRRFGRPKEVAECALFLASNAASFVTGHALVVDGGSSLRTQ